MAGRLSPLDAEAAEACETAFLAAVAAADPTKRVKRHVRQGLLDDWFGDLERPRMLHVLALGKAAPRMLWGLVEGNVPFRGVGAVPPGLRVTRVDTFTWHTGDHPVPGAASFAAGRAVATWCDGLPGDARVLVLLSGGASSVAEVAADGDEDSLTDAWRGWLRAGLPIAEMNRRRAEASALKEGRLAKRILARTPHLRVWVLSDVPPEDAPEAVGSGPFTADGVPHVVVGDNALAVEGAGQALADLGFAPHRFPRRVDGRLEEEVAAFLETASGLEGGRVALVGGGEPSLAVPDGAPAGGRARHAALLAARWLSKRGSPLVFLAAATDGVDGSRDAGAWVDAASWSPDAPDALARFDAARLLEAQGRTLTTGPTGTNVNDVWIAVRP